MGLYLSTNNRQIETHCFYTVFNTCKQHNFVIVKTEVLKFPLIFTKKHKM